jgi:signal recognition particle receptor subunit beta
MVAWQDMGLQLASFDMSADRLPVVLQCNKQDIHGALSPTQMQQMLPIFALDGDSGGSDAG